MPRWLVRLACMFALFVAAPLHVVAGPPPPGAEVVYTQQDTVGTGRLVVRPTTRSLLFAIDHPSDTTLSLDEQATLLMPLLRRLQAEYPGRPYWFVVFRDDAGLFDRIQTAAAADPNWDSRLGRPRRGTVADFVVQSINRRQLAHEFAGCFAAVGFTLRAKSVEQLLVQRRADDGVAALPASGVIGFIAQKETQP